MIETIPNPAAPSHNGTHRPSSVPMKLAMSEEIARVIARIRSRSEDEIDRVRREVSGKSRVPEPLPPGKTLADMVQGKWPGDETNEEIEAWLERIS